MVQDFSQTIREVACKLAGGKNPSISQQQEALWIVQHVARDAQISPYSMFEKTLDPLQVVRLNELVERRINNHEPLGYLLGRVPFCGLELEICPPILIPRIESEEWCQHLITQLKKQNLTKLNILDLCTGSGCIALALASSFPQATIVGIDISFQAIELARKNAAVLQLNNVTFAQMDLLAGLKFDIKFDLIVSNPPYVTNTEWQNLAPDVKDWEDKAALVAGSNGLEFYEQIAAQGSNILEKPGLCWCIVEISHQQAEAVKTIFAQKNFVAQELFKDSFGNDRAMFFKAN
jgi:release factor glutamine methyltransferase